MFKSRLNHFLVLPVGSHWYTYQTPKLESLTFISNLLSDLSGKYFLNDDKL